MIIELSFLAELSMIKKLSWAVEMLDNKLDHTWGINSCMIITQN